MRFYLSVFSLLSDSEKDLPFEFVRLLIDRRVFIVFTLSERFWFADFSNRRMIELLPDGLLGNFSHYYSDSALHNRPRKMMINNSNRLYAHTSRSFAPQRMPIFSFNFMQKLHKFYSFIICFLKFAF